MIPSRLRPPSKAPPTGLRLPAAPLPTFLPPPGAFWDRVGEVLELNVHCRSPRQGGEALGFCEIVVLLLQMSVQQLLLHGVPVAEDYLVHRDAH